jgi:hypothetical protein
LRVGRGRRSRAGVGRGLAVISALVSAGGCGGGEAQTAEAPARQPRQVIFVYDRSTSITAPELATYQALTEETLDYLDHGDRVAALEMLQLSIEETPDRWSEQVPAREHEGKELQQDSVSRVRFLRDARDYLTKYTDAEGRGEHLGTDILSTLFDVAEHLRGFPEYATTVVLFSDMRQATDEINMEGGARMPAADWVKRRKADGRLPDLSGACILVAGARTDTTEGQRVKAFWMEYFRAAGAMLLDRNYSFRPVRLPKDACREAL